jgi:hypothetical protein
VGKDLATYDDNVREVLFEKTEHYCYNAISQFEAANTGACLEKCMLRDDGEIMIGSGTCSWCVYNKGFDDDRHYIICSRLSKALGNKNV